MLPRLGVRAAFDELFDPEAIPDEGMDGFDHYRALAAEFWGEPVMFLRYRGFPAGSLHFYTRQALSDDATVALLRRLLGALGLPLDRIEV